MECLNPECIEKGYFIESEIDFPTEERMKRGPVAVIECVQNIPCNPCNEACPIGAIKVSGNINNNPRIDFQKCTGCSLCLGICPGLAIFTVDLSKEKIRITLPYELLPPSEGEPVDLLDRCGCPVGYGEVAKVRTLKQHDRCSLVTLSLPRKEMIRNVRGFRRKK